MTHPATISANSVTTEVIKLFFKRIKQLDYNYTLSTCMCSVNMCYKYYEGGDRPKNGGLQNSLYKVYIIIMYMYMYNKFLYN